MHTALISPTARNVHFRAAPRRRVTICQTQMDQVPPANADTKSLAPREMEVLTLIARGKSNSVIAQILGISIHTVDTVCRRLMAKMATSSRTTAAVRAAQKGLLPQI
ncbi:response regulator transcription factor [Aestuariibius sp. 2305UL40-4]|uniref:response regulator transcription factor n=1 Tax=Aestuariibius violaceus TaxID=3234132 RepID=UPI00345EDDDD